ncbi:MAG TPA: hypothetical protein VLH61_08020 [Bacteroidales bacterium]|nr:hypothetical protein [Bacteroidales bacterium]
MENDKNSILKDKKLAGFSPVEINFIARSVINPRSGKIPCIIVDNFPKLGLLTALRFLEWIGENPDGVISLPTGKTPEYFIKWTSYLLSNWNKPEVERIRNEYDLTTSKRPDLRGLHFVQIDEFYPIPSSQHNSFYNYVVKYYLEGFGLDRSKALLINSDEIPLADGMHYTKVFPDFMIDLSLRYRESRSKSEKIQQNSIFLIDNWCCEYESKIREKGGIGFFLGGIGPDGHIAFNTRGSDLFSTTRLTATNFETQAVAATDLGGIEVAANRLVITIGLDTITHNPEATAIIIAAGEAKANIVKKSVESDMVNIYPATVLQKLINSRFYLTSGAAAQLTSSTDLYFERGIWNHQKTERAVIDLCKNLGKYGHHLVAQDLKSDRYAKQIPSSEDCETVVNSVINSTIAKMVRGMQREENQVFLHTGPHHDDIILGLLPYIANHIRVPSNEFHFAVLTSGFTAVTNRFVIDLLEETLKLIENNQIQMLNYSDFFESGYRIKRDKDVHHYLNKVATGEPQQRRRGVCHRIVRDLVEIFKVKSTTQLIEIIMQVLNKLKNSYDGEKNPPEIQQLKGMIREFEEELVWAHYGIQVKNVNHLRLGFYQGDIFTEQPEQERDVVPVLELLRRIKPTVVSLAFDPEGSGPDTHYKVLQVTAEALRQYSNETDVSKMRVWGYRNVWFRFSPSDANIMFPVSLNGLASMSTAFNHCYISQVDASFPSYELNGKFSDLAQKIWVEQLGDIQLLLGKDYFYLNQHPKIRATHGLIYLREMTLEEFFGSARQLKKSMEGMIQ